MNIARKFVNFIGEVRAELEKVAWSTKEELKGATAVVIAMTALMAVYIGIVDVALSRFLHWMLSK